MSLDCSVDKRDATVRVALGEVVEGGALLQPTSSKAVVSAITESACMGTKGKALLYRGATPVRTGRALQQSRGTLSACSCQRTLTKVLCRICRRMGVIWPSLKPSLVWAKNLGWR